MSTSTPGSSTSDTNTVTLPEGVAIGPGRETSQTNAQGQVVQGMIFPLTLPNGTTTTIFVPYTLLGNVDQVQALFTQRVDALMAITG